MKERQGDVEPAAMTLDELRASPGYLIRRAQQITVGLFLEEFDGSSLTGPQYAALVAVNDRPGLDQTMLVRLIAIDRSTVGTILNSLEKRGFIVRQTPKHNQRIKQIVLSEAGLALLRARRASYETMQDRFLSAFSVAEAKTFMQWLVRLTEVNNDVSRAPLRASLVPAPKRRRL